MNVLHNKLRDLALSELKVKLGNQVDVKLNSKIWNELWEEMFFQLDRELGRNLRKRSLYGKQQLKKQKIYQSELF